MFPFINSITDPDVPLKDKITYFANMSFFHGANINEKQIREIKEMIKNLIESPSTRYEGLLLLEAILQQKTPFYFEQWQKVVVANLKATNAICQEITLRILKLILRPSKSTAYIFNIEKQLSPVIELLTTLDNTNCLAAIECLFLCIKRYPKIIGDKKDSVLSFLIRQMDTNSTHICEATANCLSLLPQCSVTDSNKNALTKAFSSALKKVLYTLQEIFNRLLKSEEVCFIDEEDELDQFPFQELPDAEFNEIMMFARIFSSYSTCVSKFLCQENAVFEVPVLWILKFIDRVFNLTEYVKTLESEEHRDWLKLVYPTILKGVITILESLVQNFGLVQQTGNIISLLCKAFEASYIATFIGDPNCQIRNLTWRILNTWLRRNGTQISIEAGNSGFLLRELFRDITPDTSDEVSAPSKRHQTPSKSKKIGEIFPETGENCNYNESRISTCNEALKALHEFVNTASTFQEEKYKEDIANKIFATCHEIQKNIHPLKKIPFPYMDDKIRKNLYKIVIALGTSSDFNAKVMQQAFAVLRVAQKDRSCKIRLLNRKANSIARFMLQPKKKFPEAYTHKTVIYKSAMDEDFASGWENVALWSANQSHQENHNADPHIEISNTHTEIPENSVSLSPQAHNNLQETESQSNFQSETEYNSSKFHRHRRSSQSDSDNGSIMEQELAEDENNSESNTKPFVHVVHRNNVIKNERPTEIEVSSEDENSSVGEEELEDSRMEEEEEEVEEEEEEDELSHGKSVVCADQNGLASTSEDEEVAANLTKSENGEYSSEEGSCEEEETSKEVCNDLKREIETSGEDGMPNKKLRLIENPDENIEVETIGDKLQLNNVESVITLQEDNTPNKVAQLIENSIEDTRKEESQNVNDVTNVEDDLNCINEEVVPNSCHQAEESRTSPSPTFDEMCADLVLSESSQQADS